MSRALTLLALVLAAAIVAAPAGATVKKVSFTAVVSPNDYAVLKGRGKLTLRLRVMPS